MGHKNKKNDEFRRLMESIRLNKEKIGDILLDELYIHPQKEFPTLSSISRIFELDVLASDTMEKYQKLRKIIMEDVKDIV